MPPPNFLGWNINWIAFIAVTKHFVSEQGLNLNFVYSEKATNFLEISTLLLSTVHTDKRKVEILQNFVAFSEYMNFTNWKSFQSETKKISTSTICKALMIWHKKFGPPKTFLDLF
jgi:hypothetical protein